MAMMRRLVLVRRPAGVPTEADVVLEQAPVPEPGPGQVLVRHLYLSLDPAIRGWMSEQAGYLPPIPIGAAVRAPVLGRIAASRHAGCAEGTLVRTLGTWADYSVCDAHACTVVGEHPDLPLTANLSVLGHIGLTAYVGLLDIGRPRPGDTVLVSAAAGATGSLVGQLAAIQGCRAVGLAGGPDKCRRLRDEFGYHEAIDYRAARSAPGGLAAAIAAACGHGVDVYFDNVGGDLLEAALECINRGARIVMCGAISGYNTTAPQPGPANLWQLVVKRARIEGFLVMDHHARIPEARARLARWVAEGRLRYREQIVDGLENTLEAFATLFDGRNQGKLIVKVADP